MQPSGEPAPLSAPGCVGPGPAPLPLPLSDAFLWGYPPSLPAGPLPAPAPPPPEMLHWPLDALPWTYPPSHSAWPVHAPVQPPPGPILLPWPPPQQLGFLPSIPYNVVHPCSPPCGAQADRPSASFPADLHDVPPGYQSQSAAAATAGAAAGAAAAVAAVAAAALPLAFAPALPGAGCNPLPFPCLPPHPPHQHPQGGAAAHQQQWSLDQVLVPCPEGAASAAVPCEGLRVVGSLMQQPRLQPDAWPTPGKHRPKLEGRLVCEARDRERLHGIVNLWLAHLQSIFPRLPLPLCATAAATVAGTVVAPGEEGEGGGTSSKRLCTANRLEWLLLPSQRSLVEKRVEEYLQTAKQDFLAGRPLGLGDKGPVAVLLMYRLGPKRTKKKANGSNKASSANSSAAVLGPLHSIPVGGGITLQELEGATALLLSCPSLGESASSAAERAPLGAEAPTAPQAAPAVKGEHMPQEVESWLAGGGLWELHAQALQASQQLLEGPQHLAGLIDIRASSLGSSLLGAANAVDFGLVEVQPPQRARRWLQGRGVGLRLLAASGSAEQLAALRRVHHVQDHREGGGTGGGGGGGGGSGGSAAAHTVQCVRGDAPWAVQQLLVGVSPFYAQSPLLIDARGVPPRPGTFALLDPLGVSRSGRTAGDSARAPHPGATCARLAQRGAPYALTLLLQALDGPNRERGLVQQLLLLTFAVPLTGGGCRKTPVDDAIERAGLPSVKLAGGQGGGSGYRVFVVGVRVTAALVSRAADVSRCLNVEARPYVPHHVRQLFDKEPRSFWAMAPLMPHIFPSAEEEWGAAPGTGGGRTLEWGLQQNGGCQVKPACHQHGLGATRWAGQHHTFSNTPGGELLRMMARLLLLEEAMMERDVRRYDQLYTSLGCAVFTTPDLASYVLLPHAMAPGPAMQAAAQGQRTERYRGPSLAALLHAQGGAAGPLMVTSSTSALPQLPVVLLAVHVPGLPEGRPSLYLGDAVYVRLEGAAAPPGGGGAGIRGDAGPTQVEYAGYVVVTAHAGATKPLALVAMPTPFWSAVAALHSSTGGAVGGAAGGGGGGNAGGGGGMLRPVLGHVRLSFPRAAFHRQQVALWRADRRCGHLLAPSREPLRAEQLPLSSDVDTQASALEMRARTRLNTEQRRLVASVLAASLSAAGQPLGTVLHTPPSNLRHELAALPVEAAASQEGAAAAAAEAAGGAGAGQGHAAAVVVKGEGHAAAAVVKQEPEAEGTAGLMAVGPCCLLQPHAGTSVKQEGGSRIAAGDDGDAVAIKQEQSNAEGSSSGGMHSGTPPRLPPPPPPFVLFGPPGTGKTVTLVEAALQVFHLLPASRLLLCAPQNYSADLLASAMAAAGVGKSDMVRVNDPRRSPATVKDDVFRFCRVDERRRVFALPAPCQLSSYRVVVTTCAAAGLLLEGWYAPRAGRGKHQGQQQGTSPTRPGSSSATPSEDSESGATPMQRFSHVFVDEAGQATLPECLVPLTLLTRAGDINGGSAGVGGVQGVALLAGDPRQLGPVVRCPACLSGGLATSLLERLMEGHAAQQQAWQQQGRQPPLVMLVRNYRSAERLLDLPSRLFYDGSLRAAAEPGQVRPVAWQALYRDAQLTSSSLVPAAAMAPATASEHPASSMAPSDQAEEGGQGDEERAGEEEGPSLPAAVHTLFYGVRGEQMREGDAPSYFNAIEASAVADLVEGLLSAAGAGVQMDDIGVMATYRKQVQRIRLLLRDRGLGAVRVGTVDDYQGQEERVIFISTVLSKPESLPPAALSSSAQQPSGSSCGRRGQGATGRGSDQEESAAAGGAGSDVHLGFWRNPKRFNVAITRAKSLLVVVGHPVVLVEDASWRELLRYCAARGAFRGAGSALVSALARRDVGEAADLVLGERGGGRRRMHRPTGGDGIDVDGNGGGEEEEDDHYGYDDEDGEEEEEEGSTDAALVAAMVQVAELALLGVGDADRLYPGSLDESYEAFNDEQQWRVVL